MTTPQAIIAAGRRFLGVRFAHQGRGEAGLDCLGLLIATADAAGLQFDGKPASALDVPTYGSKPDTALLHSKLLAHLTLVQVPQPADIVVLMIDGRPQHLALITDYPEDDELGMLHAYAVARKVVEHRYDVYWRKATARVFRLPIQTLS